MFSRSADRQIWVLSYRALFIQIGPTDRINAGFTNDDQGQEIAHIVFLTMLVSDRQDIS